MNEAKFLLSIGMKPKPFIKEGLFLPAIKYNDRGLREVWDSEQDGTVMIPHRTTKTA